MSRLKTAAAVASAALLCLAAGLAHAAEKTIDKSLPDERPVITMAVLDTMVNPFDAFLVQETLQALQANLPEYEIRSVSVAAAEADAIADPEPAHIFPRRDDPSYDLLHPVPVPMSVCIATETGLQHFDLEIIVPDGGFRRSGRGEHRSEIILPRCRCR